MYTTIINFLIAYDIFILPAVFLLVWVFGALNWGKNVYRKQNKQLEACRVNVLRNPKFTGIYVADIPEEYRRQWRAFVNSNAARPSLVFEFVPKKNKIKYSPIMVLAALMSFVFLAIFFFDFAHREYVVFEVAFWLAFAIVMMVDSLVFDKKERNAKQIFGRFVAQLNAAEPQGAALQDKTTAQKLNQLKKDVVVDASLEKASKILHENGLEDNRTVEEQKDINAALNGLLQAYSGNARNKPATEW